MLFCIDNLNWMLENWKFVHINKLKKGKRQKEEEEKKFNLHVMACIPSPPPSAQSCPIRSQLVKTSSACANDWFGRCSSGSTCLKSWIFGPVNSLSWVSVPFIAPHFFMHASLMSFCWDPSDGRLSLFLFFIFVTVLKGVAQCDGGREQTSGMFAHQNKVGDDWYFYYKRNKELILDCVFWHVRLITLILCVFTFFEGEEPLWQQLRLRQLVGSGGL